MPCFPLYMFDLMNLTYSSLFPSPNTYTIASKISFISPDKVAEKGFSGCFFSTYLGSTLGTSFSSTFFGSTSSGFDTSSLDSIFSSDELAFSANFRCWAMIFLIAGTSLLILLNRKMWFLPPCHSLIFYVTVFISIIVNNKVQSKSQKFG